MDTKKLFSEYVLNTYKRVGPVFAKGQGSWLWDETGKKYLDLFPGWGVSILGHAHPRIAAVIARQAKKLIHLPNNLYQAEQVLLAREIVKSSFPSKVFFANSGAEAIEGAIKLSRLYGRETHRYEVITMKNSFHGRTFAALSATGQAKYKEPFKPILPSFIEAEFNNFNDIVAKLTEKTVAVLMEPIQGEGGINVASREYVENVREFCERNRLLLIFDEVQTGMARTGKLFAFQHYGITPDIMVLSKGLGAGVPISAIAAGPKVYDLISPGMHASTFGGGPLVTAVSREVFKVIKEEKLLKNAESMGKYLAGKLNTLKKKFGCIKEIRGKGLMIGMELSCDSSPVFSAALDKGLIINSTHQTVLRIMPALNVSRAEIDKGMEILEEVLKNTKTS